MGGTKIYCCRCVRLLMDISEPPIGELSAELLPCQKSRKLQILEMSIDRHVAHHIGAGGAYRGALDPEKPGNSHHKCFTQNQLL